MTSALVAIMQEIYVRRIGPFRMDDRAHFLDKTGCFRKMEGQIEVYHLRPAFAAVFDPRVGQIFPTALNSCVINRDRMAKIDLQAPKKALRMIWTETCPGFIIANQGKMKKTNAQAKQPHDGKGFLALAGEAFQVLGEEIVHGKDKVVKVTSEKFETVKKAIQKVTHKKTVKKTAIPKKAALKPVHTAGKSVKKVAKKTVPAKKKAAAKGALSAK